MNHQAANIRPRTTLGIALAALVLAAACVLVAARAFAQPAAALHDLPLELLSGPIEIELAGRSASVQVVRGDDGPEELIRLARSAWSGAGAHVRRDDHGSWRTVSRMGRQGVEALQVRGAPNGGSEGYLISWPTGDGEGRPAHRASARDTLAHRLLPSSAVTLSDLRASGPPQGRSLVAWVPERLAVVEAAVTARAEALGLRSRTDGRNADPDPRHERSHFYTTGGAELALTLHNEGAGTALVIHLMESTR